MNQPNWESPTITQLGDLVQPVGNVSVAKIQAGQVGQEIYGAGGPFGMIIRYYWPVPKWRLMVSCDYPIDDFAVVADTVGFRILGDDRFTCEVRLIPRDGSDPPDGTIEVAAGDSDAGEITAEGHRRFVPHAGQRVLIRVGAPAARRETTWT